MLVLIWRGAEGCGHSQSPWTVILAGLAWVIVLHFRKAQACVGGKGAGGYCFWEGVALQGRGCALVSEIPWSCPYSACCQLLENPQPHPFGPGSFQAFPASPVMQETLFP